MQNYIQRIFKIWEIFFWFFYNIENIIKNYPAACRLNKKKQKKTKCVFFSLFLNGNHTHIFFIQINIKQTKKKFNQITLSIKMH